MSLLKLEVAVREAFKDVTKFPVQGEWYHEYDGRTFYCGVTSVTGKLSVYLTGTMVEILKNKGIFLNKDELHHFMAGWDDLLKYKGTRGLLHSGRLWKEIYGTKQELMGG